MKRILFCILFLIALAHSAFAQTVVIGGGGTVTIQDETVDVGVASILDCTGAGIVCAVDGSKITLTVAAGSGGLVDPGANGILSRTALDTTVARTITGTANQIAVTNGNGVSGNPTISIPTNPTLPGTTTGTFSGNLTGNVTGNVTGDVTGDLTGNADTATLATTATTANAGDSATDFFSSGTLNAARLPNLNTVATGLTASRCVETDGSSLLTVAAGACGSGAGDLTEVQGTSNEISVASGTGPIPVISLPATIDLGGKTSFELPNAAAPTTDAFGECAGDNNAWAASRGAIQCFDGTANTWLVGVLSSDTPSNGQVPKWNTGGTITWENDSTGSGFGETSLASLTTNQAFWDGTTLASGTITFDLNAGTDPVITIGDDSIDVTAGTLKQDGVAVALQGSDFAADAGANDTYTATLSPSPGSYTTGAHYRFKANTANTGAASINFNSIGAVTIVKVAGGITTALEDNDIRAGQWVDLVYDGTNMQMASPLGNAATGDITGVTAGTGLSGGGASGAVTLNVDSSEQGFLTAGALTCGASTNGKMQVHTTPLQYCDNAGTPALQYAAYGSSTGVATSATALAANGSNCSAGQFPLGVDASGAVESCTAAVVKTQSFQKCAVIKAATTADDYPLEKFPGAITITDIHVYAIGGTNVVGGLDECTGTAGVCSSVTAVDSDITGTAGSNVEDDGTLTNGGIAAGNWIQWHTTSVSGTNTSLSVCFNYTID